MIAIRSDLLDNKFLFGERRNNNAVDAFSLIHYHLIPLRESHNSADNALYYKAYSSLFYIAKRFDLGDIFAPRENEVSNWYFLQTLAFCWKEYGIINSLNKDKTSRDITERINLENIGMRALAKYGVIHTTLFKGQEHFSIFSWDISLLRKSLREVIADTR